MKFYRPLPRDKEIKINSKKFLVSKTDEKGNILYANDTFCEITGYSQSEVMGAPHNILRHPDMPSAIFFLMWQRIQNGQNIRALIKNLAKSGEYYWVTTDFEIHKNENASTSYLAFRSMASADAIETIQSLYTTLLDIEKKHGKEASLIYLQGYLDERHTNFDEFMDSVLKPKGIMAILFNKVKSSFMKSA